MDTPPFWINDPPHGPVAISSRPAPGSLLRADLERWKRSGADIVVSLLGDLEMMELELAEQPAVCASLGIEFRRHPITDHGLPSSADAFVEFVESLHPETTQGRGVVAHCYAGIGRSTMTASSLLVRSGLSLADALSRLSSARGYTVPDTAAQLAFLESIEARLRPTHCP